ncbi:MAG: hypothetical protein QY312_01545 [Candidatus Dojkabacteria bacterium]|nr:MAG: hypothetical protein QY312_01545 [Candidatus Dojkabacteria bacterium]
MERITRKKTVQLSGTFVPQKTIGEAVKPGDLLGIVRAPQVLGVYSLSRGTLLVDDGVFVSKDTPLVEYRKGFRREILVSDYDGITKLSSETLAIVAEETAQEVRATTWGRLISFTETSYIVESKLLKMPIFVSQGAKVEGELYCLLDKGMLIAPHQIPDEIAGKIVLLPGAVTKETYAEIFLKGGLGVLAPSLDWHEYVPIFSQLTQNIGILHGFGMFPLWRWYHLLLTKLHGVSIEVEYAQSHLYVPVSDILLGNLEQEMLLFKEYWWGKQVKELQHESGELIVTLETGEKTPALAEELFNIR